MLHTNHRHVLITHSVRSLKLGICTLDFVKCLKIFGEMLAVSWNGGGEVIFVTLCYSFYISALYMESGRKEVCIFKKILIVVIVM